MRTALMGFGPLSRPLNGLGVRRLERTAKMRRSNGFEQLLSLNGGPLMGSLFRARARRRMKALSTPLSGSAMRRNMQSGGRLAIWPPCGDGCRGSWIPISCLFPRSLKAPEDTRAAAFE